MKLWQKIFLPSVALTLIGIFAISLSLVVRSHTIQLEAEKDAVLLQSSEVISQLKQVIEDQKRGKFLSASILEEQLKASCIEISDENTEVSVQLLNTEQDAYENSCFTYLKECGMIQFQTVTFIAGVVCKVSISRSIQPMLNRFQEEIYTVQVYGIFVSMAISIAMLILAITITGGHRD